MEEKRHYLYRHIRLDKNEPFYIGIGTRTKKIHNTMKCNFPRAFSRHDRTKYWYNVVGTTEYEVEIMLEDLTKDEAIRKEIEFIALYGRKVYEGGSLVNLTIGGEGAAGIPKYGSDNPNYGNKMTPEQSKLMMDARGDINGENNPNCKPVINIETKQTYPYAKKVAIMEGYNYSTFKSYLKGLPCNPTKYMYLADYEAGKEFPTEYKTRENKPTVQYAVIQTETKEVFDSVRVASRHSGLKETTFHYNLAKGDNCPIPYMRLKDYEEKFGKLDKHFSPQ